MLQTETRDLEVEQHAMRNATKELTAQIEMGMDLDCKLSQAVEMAKANNTDPERVKFIEEEILFSLRQRVMDLQSLLAVNQQGLTAVEII